MKKKERHGDAKKIAITIALTLFAILMTYVAMQLPLLYKIGIPTLAIGLAAIGIAAQYGYRLDKRRKIILISIIILTAYFLTPVYHHVKYENTKGESISGTTIVTGDIEKAYTGNFWLPRGNYLVTYTGEYREKIMVEENNYFNPLPVIKTIRLPPGTFDYSQTKFYEPYEKKELQPQITLEGKDIDGNSVRMVAEKQTKIPYGTYRIKYYTKYFSMIKDIVPETPPEKIVLQPNENTVVLDQQEAEWVKNYVKEYTELAGQKIIDGTWPRQMHIYTENATLSLGGMLFVLCQLGQEEQPTIYVPKDLTYSKMGGEEFYTSMLDGKVPATINGARAEQYVYDFISDETRTAPDFGELNQKRKILEWALSYDVEYGRYVPKEGVTDATYSTCNVAMGYLTQEQCRDADYAGWISESDETWWYNEYEYPVSSGMIGWRWILELSEQYGIPTTQYMVSKDIDLFRKKDEVLFEESKELAQEGLVEIGSHTRYHTRLDTVSIATAEEELSESKKDLQQMYNVDVTGFRNPYLALVGGTIADTEKALAATSYSYYSLYGEPREVVVGNKTIEHKPINFYGYTGYAPMSHLDAAEGLPYIISLDHPWNIMFHEKETERGVVLEEAPEQPIRTLALILEAMSRGMWFTTVEKIEVK